MHWCCKSVREEGWQYTWKYSHPARVTYLRAQGVRVTCHGGWQGEGRGQQGDRKDGGGNVGMREMVIEDKHGKNEDGVGGGLT